MCVDLTPTTTTADNHPTQRTHPFHTVTEQDVHLRERGTFINPDASTTSPDPNLQIVNLESRQSLPLEKDNPLTECLWNRSPSTARGTFWVAWPVPSPSSCSTARRSSLCDVRLSTSPASSSARSVRLHLFLLDLFFFFGVENMVALGYRIQEEDI